MQIIDKAHDAVKYNNSAVKRMAGQHSVLRSLRSAAALALAAVMLFACGCGRNSANTETNIPQGTQEPSPTVEATGAPAEGGVLRLPMPVNAPHDDPLNVNTEEMLYLFSLVYDKLIAVNDSGELTPCLCESWTGEGNGTWTLHLRESAAWQDGSGRLTAQNVVDTYNALLEMPDSYYYWCTRHIESMTAMDLGTVRVKMDVPGIIALYSLTFPIRKTGELIGTGAYKTARVTDETIRLTANENWWDRKPYISTVIFEARDSNETALASYEAGQLNFVPTNVLTAGKYNQKDITNVLDVMTQGMEVLLFNNSSVFSSAEMRTAVAKGVNRSKLITNVYMNRARASDVPIPADSWLYDSRSAVLNYDSAAALALLEGQGYTQTDSEGVRYSIRTGKKLTLRLLTSATTENTTRADAAAMIASQLGELGFKVEVITAEHTLGDAESPFALALAAGDWDLALVGFNLCIDCDPSPYLANGGACNFTACGDSQSAMLIDSMRRAETEEALREAAYAFQNYFVESVPFVTLYFRLNSIVYSADIMGLSNTREPDLLAGIKDWYIVK